MTHRLIRLSAIAAPALGLCAALAHAGAQPEALNVQFKSIDFVAGVIEITNCGDTTVDLDGWRFCSHSDLDDRDYTGLTSLNGRSLAPGESLFIHTQNDADEPDEINIAALGNFEQLRGLTPGSAYSINLFWPNGGSISFGSPADMADHVQWSFGGVNAGGLADTRNGVAFNAGLWTSTSNWIATSATTTRVNLTDTTCAVLHSSANYEVIEEVEPVNDCPSDFNNDGMVDGADFGTFGAAFGSMSGDANFLEAADFDANGVIDGADFGAFGAEFGRTDCLD